MARPPASKLPPGSSSDRASDPDRLLPEADPLPQAGLRVLAGLYGGIMRWRNAAYDRGLKRSFAFDYPVIGVGNLRVGGTGKTPTVAWLAERLLETMPVGTLSRGYGRRTRGYRLLNEKDRCADAGDEALLLYRRLSPLGGAVAVGERRVEALPALLLERPDLKAVLLDDAFQHRSIRPGLQILCTAWGQLYSDDACLPAGRLREPASGARRADVVLVTKCPPMLLAERGAELRERLRQHLGLHAEQALFCSALDYGALRPFATGQVLPEHPDLVLVLSGIAEPGPFQAFARERFPEAECRDLAFPDHHRWRDADLQRIREAMDGAAEALVLTTEKDAVRLADLQRQQLTGIPLAVQPVEPVFPEAGEAERLLALLRDFIAAS
jgi:tetraacyldisaccharide 4'-kinase